MNIKPMIAAALAGIFVLTGCDTSESSKNEVQSEEEIIDIALNLEKVRENLIDKEIVKKIYIENKLVNFAVK